MHAISDSLAPLNARRDRLGNIAIAAALSVLLHIAMLGWQPRMQVIAPDGERGATRGPLSVQLAPPPSARPAPPPAPAMEARRPSPPRARAPKAASRPPPKPPVLARKEPSPSVPALPDAPPPVAAPQPPRAPAGTDLSSYVEARRRARAEATAPSLAFPSAVPSTPPEEDPDARANRLAAANLGTNRKPTFGEPARGGGIFSVRHVAYDYAEFVFYGWNRDIRRNTAQVIEVRKGDNSDIRIAVVRKMIAIIREYEQEDFLWESQRLGRTLTLSARARDNAALEEFMMREFF